MSLDIRNKLIELADQLSLGLTNPTEDTATFLGEVVDSPTIPTADDRFVLVYPVAASGKEKEGDTATLTADTTRKIPVVFLGSAPSPGDRVVCYSLGGRWVSLNAKNFVNCNPKAADCTGKRYSVNGTVTDQTNGVQPMVYDFVKGAWYSPWLKHTSSFILATSPGVNPCAIGTGTSYYYYTLATSGGQLIVTLFMPGTYSCSKADGTYTSAYYGYPGPTYPGLLGKPADSLVDGFAVYSLGQPLTCDPLAYTANFAAGGIKATLPVTDAQFSIPKYTPPRYGFSCTTPCPLPQRDLTVSWVNPTIGNGSAVLKWKKATKDWQMDCFNGLVVRLFTIGSSTYGFSVTTYANAECNGTGTTLTYPAQISFLSFNCEPLDLVFKLTFTTSAAYLKGYRTFTVTL